MQYEPIIDIISACRGISVETMYQSMGREIV